MASLSQESGAVPEATLGAGSRLNPNWCFWVVGLIVYGGAAAHFATGHFLDQTSRDLWQHLASLRELIRNPFHPANPFVPTAETSRHFHPYWVAIALLARAVGWNEWQAIAFAGYVGGVVLLTGIYAFGRAFYRDPWGPLALLAAMGLGWMIPVCHTGYHSLETLIEGIAYPAVLLIGLSFMLWALVIRALDNPRWAWLIAPLAAFMFATHQLGAIVGFIAAGWLILLWPKGNVRRRTICTFFLGAGIFVSAFWPYLGPFAAIFRTGNASWAGGPNYYSIGQLLAAFVPQALGLIGLVRQPLARRGRPILAALATYLLLYPLGLFGVMIATRMLMPAVLVLHIGMGALFLSIAHCWSGYTDRRRLSLVAVAVLFITIHAFLSWRYLGWEAFYADDRGNAYVAAEKLTADIPDNQPVAAYDVAVWPVVATGQRALSVPWPEPGIADLKLRQHAVEQLFDPHLSRAERMAVARRWGVRVLLLDRAGPERRHMPFGLPHTLQRQSQRSSKAGPFIRFDLY